MKILIATFKFILWVGVITGIALGMGVLFPMPTP